MTNFDPNKYVPVSERLAKFYEAYPGGRIVTTMLAHEDTTGLVIFKAETFRTVEDAEASATGHAAEIRGTGHVNKTSHIENCETSAVGRALALLGFDVLRGIASREEMAKVERMEKEVADLEVVREEGQYRVGPFTVTKPNGKVICKCKKAGCRHIEAVREFVKNERAAVDGASFNGAYPEEPPFRSPAIIVLLYFINWSPSLHGSHSLSDHQRLQYSTRFATSRTPADINGTIAKSYMANAPEIT